MAAVHLNSGLASVMLRQPEGRMIALSGVTRRVDITPLVAADAYGRRQQGSRIVLELHEIAVPLLGVDATAVEMALAILAGDMEAAGPLADLILERHRK